MKTLKNILIGTSLRLAAGAPHRRILELARSVHAGWVSDEDVLKVAVRP